jgi:hypothetical protein
MDDVNCTTMWINQPSKLTNINQKCWSAVFDRWKSKAVVIFHRRFYRKVSLWRCGGVLFDHKAFLLIKRPFTWSSFFFSVFLFLFLSPFLFDSTVWGSAVLFVFRFGTIFNKDVCLLALCGIVDTANLTDSEFHICKMMHATSAACWVSQHLAILHSGPLCYQM